MPLIPTLYDRTLARMSRRELMKLAWLLGAAAVAPPVLTRRVLAKPIFDAYPFPLGIASGGPPPPGGALWVGRPPAGGRRLGDAARAKAARGRRHADGERRGGLGGIARPALRVNRAEGHL